MNPLITFKKNTAEVDQLIDFDKEVLQVVTMTIESLHSQLKPLHGDERLNGGRALQVIRGIRDNKTLEGKYQTIHNQAIVLLVSHFASALGEAFRTTVAHCLENTDTGKLFDEEIKITIRDIKELEWNLKGGIAEILIAKHDFTFQDMASTVRAFKNYANIELTRDIAMNNIITAQACRHVIVHSGGRITERTIRQLSGAFPRTLKPEVTLGDAVKFSIQEVNAIKNDMICFVERLCK